MGIYIILSYKIIKKFKIRIDEKFLLGLLPFLIQDFSPGLRDLLKIILVG